MKQTNILFQEPMRFCVVMNIMGDVRMNKEYWLNQFLANSGLPREFVGYLTGCEFPFKYLYREI